MEKALEAWRTKQIRLQEQPALKRTPRSYKDSDLDTLGIDGKIIQYVSNGTGLRLKFVRSRRESSEEVDVQFLSRRCDAVFRSLGLVSCFSPLGACPKGLARL